MRNVIAVLLFAAFIVTVGCKDEQEKAKAALEVAKAAQKQAVEAAKVAEEAAKTAQEAAGEAMDEDSEDSEATPGQPQNLQDAMAQMKKAIEQNTPNVEPVNFRDLKKMLPEKVGDLARNDARGEKAGAMGVKVSHAEGKYKGDGGKTARVKIIDMGSMKGFAAMAATGWAMAEIDRESDDGYERTTKIEGFKAYEKYNEKNGRAEIKLIIGDRFMVELEGRKIDMKVLKSALDDIDLKALAAMKDEGVKKE